MFFFPLSRSKENVICQFLWLHTNLDNMNVYTYLYKISSYVGDLWPFPYLGRRVDKEAYGAYTNGKVPDQIAQSCVGARSSLLVLHQGPYIM